MITNKRIEALIRLWRADADDAWRDREKIPRERSYQHGKVWTYRTCADELSKLLDEGNDG